MVDVEFFWFGIGDVYIGVFGVGVYYVYMFEVVL